MIFSYRARKSPTEAFDGIVEADDEQAALIHLKKLGYYPFHLRRQRVASTDLRSLVGRRLSARDLSLFSRQLATLIGSGVGLAEALRLVMGQVANSRLREVLGEILVRVEGGESLSEAMANYRAVFPSLLVSVISAGETGGMLAQVFDRAASHYEMLEELKGKVVGALIYPLFLFLVGAVSVGVLVTFVVPRFAALFTTFGQDLPWPTLVLLSVSGFMASYWWMLLTGLAVFVVAFYRITRTGPGRLAWDAFKLETPFAGDFIRKMETAKFARTLAALLANGVPMLQALDVVADTLGNKKVAANLTSVRQAVEKGSGLSEALESHASFTSTAVSLVRIGESSGATPEMLEKIAGVYEREVDRTAKALATLLEPVLIIFMGGCVAFVVMAMLLPVFRLNMVVQ